MTIAEKEMTISNNNATISAHNVTIAENEQKVYEAGKKAGEKAEYNKFWDSFQYNGTRTNYEKGFYTWSEDIFYPKYGAELMYATDIFRGFNGKIDLASRLEECGVYFDFSKITTAWGIRSCFTYSHFTRVGRIDFSGYGGGTKRILEEAFSYTYELKTIDTFVVNENIEFRNVFLGASKLENLTIEGTIGQNGFNVQWSPLTHESLMSIINALADKTADTSGTVWTVTLGATNRAKLTEEEILIAELKGWEIA